MYQFVLNLFLLIIVFFPAGHGRGQFEVSVFVLPVGLYDWKITTAHPTLTIMFKNILRTFEAEVLQHF